MEHDLFGKPVPTFPDHAHGRAFGPSPFFVCMRQMNRRPKMRHDNPVIAARFCGRVLSCARSPMDRALAKNMVTSSAKPVRCRERAGVRPVFQSSVTPASSDQSNKMKEAERRQTLGNHCRILRCGARPFGARTLDGVPPRLSPKGIIPSQRLSFRPGFLGRGLNGRYPPSPVPVQGCTSHPGRNAGRHDAQAAREQAANPPAGTALAPTTRCASAPCPSLERDCEVTDTGTNVKRRLRKRYAGGHDLSPQCPLHPKADIRLRRTNCRFGP